MSNVFQEGINIYAITDGGGKNWTLKYSKTVTYSTHPPMILSFQVKILYLVVSSFVMLGKYFHIIQLNLDDPFIQSLRWSFSHLVYGSVIQSVIPLVHWLFTLSVIQQITTAYFFLFQELSWVLGIQQWKKIHRIYSPWEEILKQAITTKGDKWEVLW